MEVQQGTVAQVQLASGFKLPVLDNSGIGKLMSDHMHHHPFRPIPRTTHPAGCGWFKHFLESTRRFSFWGKQMLPYEIARRR